MRISIHTNNNAMKRWMGARDDLFEWFGMRVMCGRSPGDFAVWPTLSGHTSFIDGNNSTYDEDTYSFYFLSLIIYPVHIFSDCESNHNFFAIFLIRQSVSGF